ncbi:hypothetical protein ACJX0J_037712, partial [Zea mays]
KNPHEALYRSHLTMSGTMGSRLLLSLLLLSLLYLWAWSLVYYLVSIIIAGAKIGLEILSNSSMVDHVSIGELIEENDRWTTHVAIGLFHLFVVLLRASHIFYENMKQKG